MTYFDKDNNEYNNTSRYQTLRVIVDTTENCKYLETYNQKFIPTSSDDVFHVVQMSEKNRLDIISNNYYGTPTYWWSIALANEIIDPFRIPVDSVLRIPPLTSLSDYRNEILTRRG